MVKKSFSLVKTWYHLSQQALVNVDNTSLNTTDSSYYVHTSAVDNDNQSMAVTSVEPWSFHVVVIYFVMTTRAVN